MWVISELFSNFSLSLYTLAWGHFVYLQFAFYIQTKVAHSTTFIRTRKRILLDNCISPNSNLSERYFNFMHNNYSKIYLLRLSVRHLSEIIHFEALKMEHQNSRETQFSVHTHTEAMLGCKIDFGMVALRGVIKHFGWKASNSLSDVTERLISRYINCNTI